MELPSTLTLHMAGGSPTQCAEIGFVEVFEKLAVVDF